VGCALDGGEDGLLQESVSRLGPGNPLNLTHRIRGKDHFFPQHYRRDAIDGSLAVGGFVLSFVE